MGLDKTLLKKKGQPDAERGHYHEIGQRKKGLSSTFYCFIVYFGLLLLMAALTNVGLHLAIQLVASKGGHPLILPLLNHVAAAASISLFVLVSVCLARKSGSGFLVVMFMAVCVLFLTLSVTTLTSLHVGKVIHECPHHLHHNNNKHHNTNSNIHHPHLPPHKPHHNKHNDFLPIKVEQGQGEEEAEGNGILSTSFFRLETIVKLNNKHNNKHHLNDNNKNNKNKHEHEYLVRAGCWQMSWSQHMMLTASLGALAMMAVSTIGLLLIGSLAALQLLPYEEQEEQEEDDEEEGVMAGRRNKDGYELLLTSDSS